MMETDVTYAPLPPYRAMLAVDMKDFSSHLGRDHAALTDRIPEILDAAFTRAGDGDLWAERKRFSRSDGDGYVAGFQPAVLPFLLNPFLRALQIELEHQNQDDPVVPGRPIRMRVSINVGPVTDSGDNTISDGSGTARVETHRLLDAPAVKDVLERSGPETYVAAIVSARAYEDAVMTGYAGVSEDYFAPVEVQVKKYRGVAFLRVPNPTGELMRTGLWPRVKDERGDGPPERSDSGMRTVGTWIETAHGPVHSGKGDQYNDTRPGNRKARRDRG